MDERTGKIVEIFKQSWEDVEKQYARNLNNYGREKYLPLLEFISAFRKKGDNQFFRAGTSLSTLMISRSVNHGLREDQKYISIYVIDHNIYEIMLRGGDGKIYREYKVTSLEDEQLLKLLRTLKETLVD